MQSAKNIKSILLSSFITLVTSPMYWLIIFLYSLIFWYTGATNKISITVQVLLGIFICKHQLVLTCQTKTQKSILQWLLEILATAWQMIKFYTCNVLFYVCFVLFESFLLIILHELFRWNIKWNNSLGLILSLPFAFYYVRIMWLALPLLLDKKPSIFETIKQTYYLTKHMNILLIVLAVIDMLYLLIDITACTYPDYIFLQTAIGIHITIIISMLYTMFVAIFRTKLYRHLEEQTIDQQISKILTDQCT